VVGLEITIGNENAAKSKSETTLAMCITTLWKCVTDLDHPSNCLANLCRAEGMPDSSWPTPHGQRSWQFSHCAQNQPISTSSSISINGSSSKIHYISPPLVQVPSALSTGAIVDRTDKPKPSIQDCIVGKYLEPALKTMSEWFENLPEAIGK